MHRMHRIFSGNGWLVMLSISKSAHDHCPSRHLVQQRPLLVILCILCIDVNDEPFLFVFIRVHSWFILYTRSAISLECSARQGDQGTEGECGGGGRLAGRLGPPHFEALFTSSAACFRTFSVTRSPLIMRAISRTRLSRSNRTTRVTVRSFSTLFSI